LLASVFLSARTCSTPLPTLKDKEVALLRQNLRAKAKQLIVKNMQLADTELGHSGRCTPKVSPKSAR
jgi:hypothetical protein